MDALQTLRALRLRRALQPAIRSVDRKIDHVKGDHTKIDPMRIDPMTIDHPKIGPVVHRWTGAFVATPISAGRVPRCKRLRRTPTIPRRPTVPTVTIFCSC